MRVISDIDVLGDEVCQRRMLRLSVGLAVGVAVVIATVAVTGPVPFEGPRPLRLALLCGASLVAHELVHAACFRLFGGRGCRVGFGWKSGMLYTRAEGVVLTRPQAYVTLLAPAVLVDIALVAIGVARACPYLALACVLVHLSGCAGDILMCREIACEPAAAFVMDTDTGIALLAAGDD